MKGKHVIFGTGPLGRYTAEALLQTGLEVILINRSGAMPSPPDGAALIKADALSIDKRSEIFSGATAIYQCAQPPYHRWKEEFPKLQNAVLSIAAERKAKLISAENLYMYGNTHGKPMSEDTPDNPCSSKGQVRMEMSNSLFDAWRQGTVQIAVVRGSDFFGPWEPVYGDMIFKAAIKKKTVNMLGDLNQPHSFTYVKDFGKALAIAGTDDRATGKIWHVPSGKPYTQNELAQMISKELGYPVKARATGKFMLSLAGMFNKSAKEVIEMLYEFNEPFILNSEAMEKTFGLTATPMEQRIKETIEWAKSQG
ncbi:MAG: NAD-dependent epimerase/dehydratase family protein [Ignavibacteria bacterium]|nr:NAD-dependent epimerase/dehydratase family protein [Ignavibacteria bacterium]